MHAYDVRNAYFRSSCMDLESVVTAKVYGRLRSNLSFLFDFHALFFFFPSSVESR